MDQTHATLATSSSNAHHVCTTPDDESGSQSPFGSLPAPFFKFRSLHPPRTQCYLGNDTSTIPQPMINYLAGIRALTGDVPVRIRVGGNSADISTYVESQTSPMAVLNNPNAIVSTLGHDLVGSREGGADGKRGQLSFQ
ncbi:hypothetical protein B0H13DRAFT_2369828 [Mycena leptocephala]|nr:hypothetical protein B0H13DRAFT_2369828 [Mycena leptocephala]